MGLDLEGAVKVLEKKVRIILAKDREEQQNQAESLVSSKQWTKKTLTNTKDRSEDIFRLSTSAIAVLQVTRNQMTWRARKSGTTQLSIKRCQGSAF